MSKNSEQASKKGIKTFYISTIFSISLVLLMVGLLGLIVLHAKNLSNFVKENIVLNIILDEQAKDADIFKLQKEIEKNPAIKDTEYISKELAARNLSKDLGEDFIKFLGYNPLTASIDVYLKAEYATNDEIQKFTRRLKSKDFVKEVVYQESLVDLVNQNLRSISIIIVVFGATLLLIAVALINNTIRLAMYSQRFIIRSMQLVGATRGFIRKPFVLTGILHGLLGALISIAILIGTLFLARNEVPDLIILEDYTEFAILFFGIISMGILISFFSTFFAVNKYLNQHIDDLYKK
ncbi:MAG: permease-like cell division protein FtsX [Sphingobacteriales bacterium]|jgi:cell division transport system permease protein|nr:permease-like cell division protein FtsX [Sphingobacteriales bacterium]